MIDKAQETHEKRTKTHACDCISRQGVLKILTDISYNHCPTAQASEAVDLAKTMVAVMPSAQPERKTGKWIDDNIFGQLPVIICDQCKTFFPLQFGDSHNFCPNCGADMRGEQDE